jgi:hypothetical protein
MKVKDKLKMRDPGTLALFLIFIDGHLTNDDFIIPSLSAKYDVLDAGRY